MWLALLHSKTTDHAEYVYLLKPEQIVGILQTTFKNVYLWMKTFFFWFRLNWVMFLRLLSALVQLLVQHQIGTIMIKFTDTHIRHSASMSETLHLEMFLEGALLGLCVPCAITYHCLLGPVYSATCFDCHAPDGTCKESSINALSPGVIQLFHQKH